MRHPPRLAGSVPVLVTVTYSGAPRGLLTDKRNDPPEGAAGGCVGAAFTAGACVGAGGRVAVGGGGCVGGTGVLGGGGSVGGTAVTVGGTGVGGTNVAVGSICVTVGGTGVVVGAVVTVDGGRVAVSGTGVMVTGALVAVAGSRGADGVLVGVSVGRFCGLGAEPPHAFSTRQTHKQSAPVM